TGRLRLTLEGHRGTVWTASFDRAGGRIITAGDDGTARLWDRATGAVLAVLEGHAQLAIRAELTADGTRAVTASYDGTAVVWDTAPSFLARQWAGGETTD